MKAFTYKGFFLYNIISTVPAIKYVFELWAFNEIYFDYIRVKLVGKFSD